MPHVLLLLSWFLLLFLSPGFCAADWPMFHGPDGKNRSPDTGLLTVWPEGGPKLVWRTEGIGETISGYSAVSLQNGRLFTTGNRNERSIIYCLDLDGKKLWEYDNGPAWIERRVFPGTRSTPTIDGDYLYDFTAHGELTCLTIEGKKVWNRNMMADFEAENIIWGLSESIRIDGDRLYCAPGGKKGSFVALDKRTGETIWATPWLGEKTSYASPIIFERGARRIIATTYAKGLFGVDAENGELLFRFRHEHQYDINCTRLLYHDDHLLITNSTTGAVQLKLTDKEDKIILEETWRNKDLDNLHDGVMLLDGFLYASSYDFRGGVFMCVDWKDGSTQYSDGRDVGKGSFTWAEGFIYFLSERGAHVLLIRPDPEKYDVISRFNLPDTWDTPTWAHPVICGKRLYIRNDTVLYCYDLNR